MTYKRFLVLVLSYLLATAGMMVEGSVDQALKGQHYRRGLRCIMLCLEALIHKRLSIALENEFDSTENINNLEVLKKALTENKENLASAYTDLEMGQNIQKLVHVVYDRTNTDMGECWMSFQEASNIFLQSLDARHVNNLDEYLLSTRAKLPVMLAYNNHDYGRLLPDYWATISSFPYEKRKYFSEYFAQSMTGLPYSNQPIDLWIQFTKNLDSKLNQGWLQSLQNGKHLFCTTCYVNNVTRIKTALKHSLNCHLHHLKHASQQE